MSIAIITSGGDSAGMNPAVKRFVEYAYEKNETPYLIYDGLEGLIDNKIHKADPQKINDIVHRGGTMLRTSRSKRFFDIAYRQQAYDNLKANKIKKLVVVGGDGSFKALNQFYADFKVPFVGIPATIDNDIFGTDYCLGVDTALNVIVQSIDSVRDTAYSFRRAFVIETMGRHSGYLALVSAIASGAEICLIPEIKPDFATMKKRLQKTLADGKIYLMAIVAEGTEKANYLTEWLEVELGMESRLTTLGHIQRGGNPTVFDRLQAYEFVTFAIDGLLNGHTNDVVVYKSSKYGYKSIEEVSQKPQDPRQMLNPKYLKQGTELSR